MPPRPLTSITSYFPIFAGTLEVMMFQVRTETVLRQLARGIAKTPGSGGEPKLKLAPRRRLLCYEPRPLATDVYRQNHVRVAFFRHPRLQCHRAPSSSRSPGHGERSGQFVTSSES